jgi:hypothetical protein
MAEGQHSLEAKNAEDGSAEDGNLELAVVVGPRVTLDNNRLPEG